MDLTKSSLTSQPASSNDLAAAVFERLGAIFGASFSSQFDGSDRALMRAEWGRALSGMTPQELRRGLDAAASSRFAPNLPALLLLCRPSLDPDVAWAEAERGLAAHANGKRFEWSHPAVYWAAAEMPWEVRGGGIERNRRRWAAVLAAEFARDSWAAIPDPSPRLEHHDPRGVSMPSAVRNALRSLREKLVTRHG